MTSFFICQFVIGNEYIEYLFSRFLQSYSSLIMENDEQTSADSDPENKVKQLKYFLS
jgi:hypothetical protein